MWDYHTIFFRCFFNVFCASVSNYGSEIWEFEPKDAITKIYSRATRSFLGLSKTPTSVCILTYINWMEPVFTTQIRMVRQFCQVLDMKNDRLTKKSIDWNRNISKQVDFHTCYTATEIKIIFTNHNHIGIF